MVDFDVCGRRHHRRRQKRCGWCLRRGQQVSNIEHAI